MLHVTRRPGPRSRNREVIFCNRAAQDHGEPPRRPLPPGAGPGGTAGRLAGGDAEPARRRWPRPARPGPVHELRRRRGRPRPRRKRREVPPGGSGMIAVCDTGPLVAAVNRRDNDHEVCRAALSGYPGVLIVPVTVAVEVDYLLRARVSPEAARAFLADVDSGAFTLDSVGS